MNRKVIIGIGIAAAVVTPAVAIICDRKAKAKLEGKKDEKVYSLTEIREQPLYYLPAVLTASVSIAALIGLNKKYCAGMATAYAATKVYAKKYGNLIEKVEELAPKMAKEFKKEIIKGRDFIERSEINPPENPIIAYEMFSGRMFYTTEKDVLEAENTVDRILSEHDDVSLNDFYDCLGIEQSTFGSQWGLNIYENITEAGWKNTWIEVEEGKEVLFIDGPKWELLF